MHLDAFKRAEALNLVRSQFGESFALDASWDVLAVCDGEEVVGSVMTRGPEVHFCADRVLYLRGLMRRVLCGLIEKYGFASTKVRASHALGLRYVRRLGFNKTHEADGLVHFILREYRYA